MSEHYRVYRRAEWPKPKRYFYPGTFEKRQQARQFCRNRVCDWPMFIVHPDGHEEEYQSE